MYTPGPWYEAQTGNHQGLIVSEKTGENIATSYKKDDAALIAAAPAMLDALTQLNNHLTVNHLDEYTFVDDGDDPFDPERIIRDAIAKAEGRS